MSVLQNDPSSKAILWADIYVSVYGAAQGLHIESTTGTEAQYLKDVNLATHSMDMRFDGALNHSIDKPIEEHIAHEICLQYGAPACSVIPAYGLVDINCDYFVVILPTLRNMPGYTPTQILITCERRANEH